EREDLAVLQIRQLWRDQPVADRPAVTRRVEIRRRIARRRTALRPEHARVALEPIRAPGRIALVDDHPAVRDDAVEVFDELLSAGSTSGESGQDDQTQAGNLSHSPFPSVAHGRVGRVRGYQPRSF